MKYATGDEVFEWPEFKAFAERLGIEMWRTEEPTKEVADDQGS